MVSFGVPSSLLFLTNDWSSSASPMLGTLGRFKDDDVSAIIGAMVVRTGGADDDGMGTEKDLSKKYEQCASDE